MPTNKTLGLSVLTGLLLSLSWPTYGFVGLIFFGFLPLLIVFHSLRAHKPKRVLLSSFGWAYLSFFIFNIITTNWLYFASSFGMWFAVLANSALMAMVFLVYQFIALRTTNRNALIFLIALWIGFEKMHLHWDLAWPWLNLGNAFSENINWVQWYEYTGTFGGTLWVWIVNMLVFNAYLRWKAKTFSNFTQPVSILAVIVIPIFISFVVKSQYDTFEDSSEIIVLQPNIDPYTEKYYTSNQKISDNLFDLITLQKPTKDALVIAPETVYAKSIELSRFQSSEANRFSARLHRAYPEISLLSGVSMYELIRNQDLITPQSNFLKEGVWYNDFNSAFFKKRNQPLEFYHKSKLVVGVEYFPYKSVLEPILGNVMLDLGGTIAIKTTQEDRSVFKVNDNLKVAPIICYESVFGEFVTGYVKNGATVLGIITNDAWWNNTQGHKQHFSYAKLRAVETRRSVARSANTGISGFIDPIGNVIEKSNYDERISLKSSVPISTKMTFYVQHGDYIARIAYFFILFIGIFAIIKHKRTGIKR
jgi:apolipoprotein N-acyltransferase